MRCSVRLFIPGLVVRDDVHIQIGQFDQAVCQTFLSKRKSLLVVDPAHDDLGDAADPGVLRDLHSRVRAIYSGDLCPQLFREAQVAAEPRQIFAGQLARLRRLHKERGKSAVEGLRHPRGGPDHSGVGGRGGEADQNMLPARALFSFPSRTAAWFSWSAVRRMAISRNALRLSTEKKWKGPAWPGAPDRPSLFAGASSARPARCPPAPPAPPGQKRGPGSAR